MSATTLQALILWFGSLALVGLMLWDYVRYKVHLMSIRNLLIIGFIVYQMLSPSYTLMFEQPDKFHIDDLAGTGWIFLTYVALFLIFFLGVYRVGWVARPLAHKVPIYKRELSENAMVVLAVVATLLAAIFQAVPLISTAIFHVLFFSTVALTTLSTGLVTWWWMRRSLNVARSAVALSTICANLALMMTGAFSRRPVVAITLMFVWTVYYARSRYSTQRMKIVVTLVLASLPMIILASKLTSARFHGMRDMASSEVIQFVITEGSITEGMAELMGGQLVGEAALWCIEAFPEDFQRRHLFSLRYYFLSNVPRELWEDKPYGLSSNIAYYADIQGVNQNRALGERGVTLPPGVVGYAAAEGGYYAVIVYALIFGIVARFLDELAATHATRIAVVLPIAASLGSTMGVLRGDMSLFALGATWSILVSFLLLALASLTMGQQPSYMPHSQVYQPNR